MIDPSKMMITTKTSSSSSPLRGNRSTCTTTTSSSRRRRRSNTNGRRCHDDDDQEELLPLQQQEQQIQEQQQQLQQQQQQPFLHDVVAATDNNNNTSSSPSLFLNNVVSSTSTNHEDIIINNDHNINNNNNKFSLLLGILVSYYNIFLSKFYWFVLFVIVIVLWPFGYYALKDLTANTDSTFKHGISNSLSQIAEHAFDKIYNNNNHHHHNHDDNNNNDNIESWDNHPLILVVLSLLEDEQNSNSTTTITTTTTTTKSSSSLIHNEYVQNTSLMLQSYLEENLFFDDDNHNNNNNNKSAAASDNNKIINIEVSSYYSYKKQNLTLLGWPYMSHDGKTTIVEINYKTNPTKIHLKQKSIIVSKIDNALTDYYYYNNNNNNNDNDNASSSYYYNNNNNNNNLQVGFTGLDYFSHDLRLATQYDLKRMDILVLPISLLLLGYTINPYRLWLIWIIPLIAIISTISTWSIITYHIIMIQCNIQITQFTPSIMMSLTLGMGMDYTLFLLSRYSEAYNKTRRGIEKSSAIQTTPTSTNDTNNNNNINNGESENRNNINNNNSTKDEIKFYAIQEMLQHTSKVILVSGITLLCTFLALIALPLKMIQSVGWGCATCIASAIILNLVTIPALLYTKLGDWIISSSDLEGQQQEEESEEESEEEGREHHHLPLLTSSEEQTPFDDDDGTSNQQLLRQHPLLLENGGNTFSSPPPPLESTSSPPDNISSSAVASAAGAGTVDVVLSVDQQSFWIRLSKHYLLHPYKSIIVMLLLWQFLFWPLGKNALRLKSTSIAFESLLPTQSQSMQTYRRLMTGMDKGPGRMAPFRILVDFSNSSFRLDSPDGFDILHRLVREMTTTTVSDTASDAKTLSTPSGKYQNDTSFSELMPLWRTSMNFNSISSTDDSTDKYVRDNDKTQRPLPKATFTGISVMDNIPIPYAIYVASKICGGGGGGGGHNNKNSSSWCPIEAMRALNVLDCMVTSHDRMATYLTAELSVSPFSDDGVYWLNEMRKRIANFNQNHTTVGGAVNSRGGVDIYIDGSAAIAHDAVQAVYQAFPWVVGITLGVVFGLLGLYFGSIVPPLRSVVSISCTLAVAFGSAVLVYQDEMFSHTQQIMATVPELCWLVPVMSFSIIVGLALDYDVFLVSRIYEFRSLDGYRHESSVVAGLNATGGIITAAGIIMATAFGSLLWSASPALEQWAFMVTTAVLLDTFVTRTAVVPILLGWTGTYSWYPHKFESSDGNTRRLEGFDEDHDDSIARALDTDHTLSEQGNRGEQEEEPEIL